MHEVFATRKEGIRTRKSFGPVLIEIFTLQWVDALCIKVQQWLTEGNLIPVPLHEDRAFWRTALSWTTNCVATLTQWVDAPHPSLLPTPGTSKWENEVLPTSSELLLAAIGSWLLQNPEKMHNLCPALTKTQLYEGNAPAIPNQRTVGK